MRSSRIARDTSKISEILPSTTSFPRRSSRSAASPNPLVSTTANITATTKSTLISRLHKNLLAEEYSYPTPAPSADIEDHPAVPPAPSTRKRKHVGAVPASPVRVSPRKVVIKSELKEEALEFKDVKREHVKRQPAKQVVNGAGEVEIHPPPGWEEVYEVVKGMRKLVLAPVDTMGCERLAERTMSPKDQRFQTLIALMLSSQTKDTVTAAAIANLQVSLPGGLTLSSIRAVEPETLNLLIHSVGFHNNKTRYIKAVAEILHTQYADDIPSTAEGLMALPGVGPKMAYLCMSAAWGQTEGIGVDVHVHRITNLWGWHTTKTPEETRKMLQGWLPREKWHEINHLLVGFGQTICTPVGRDCTQCDLSTRGLCPSAVVGRKKRVKVERVKVEMKGEDVKERVDAEVKLEVKEEDSEEILADGRTVHAAEDAGLLKSREEITSS